MKTNDEKILKYLSENVSSTEKREIEKEIESSKELSEEFTRMQKVFSDLKNDSKVETEIGYFNNLLPRVREKLDSRKKIFTIQRLAFSIPVAALLFVISLSINIEQTESLFSLSASTEEIYEAIDETSSDNLIDYIDNDYYTYDVSELTISETGLSLDNESLQDLGESTFESFENYSLIENLSDKEVDEIYNEILTKKIL